MRVFDDPTFAALSAIRHWSDVRELAHFADERHGFGDSNGGFGITYPGDLDERDNERKKIPDGYVLGYGFWGPPDGYEILIAESLYRDVLAEVLECSGHLEDARRVRPANGWYGVG